MTNEIFEEIKKFTVMQTGVSESKVTEEAGLENDLGVSGDEAVDYLIAFSKKFEIDMSNFMAADYFSPEGDFILPAILRLFTGKKHPKQKELKMKHLVKAVIAGRLDEEVINS